MRCMKIASLIVAILLLENVLADEERRNCQQSMRVALQNIFDDFQNNNTVCVSSNCIFPFKSWY